VHRTRGGKEIFLPVMPKSDESHGTINNRQPKLRCVANCNKQMFGLELMGHILNFNEAVANVFKNDTCVVEYHSRMSGLENLVNDLAVKFKWAPYIEPQDAIEEFSFSVSGSDGGFCFANGDDMKMSMRLNGFYFVVGCDYTSYDITICESIITKESEYMGESAERYRAIHSLDWKYKDPKSNGRIVLRHLRHKMNRPSGTPNTSSANTLCTLITWEMIASRLCLLSSTCMAAADGEQDRYLELFTNSAISDLVVSVCTGLGFRPKVQVWNKLHQADFLKSVNCGGTIFELPSRIFKSLSCVRHNISDMFSKFYMEHELDVSRGRIGTGLFLHMYAMGKAQCSQSIVDEIFIKKYLLANTGVELVEHVMDASWKYRTYKYGEEETVPQMSRSDYSLILFTEMIELRYGVASEDFDKLLDVMMNLNIQQWGECEESRQVIERMISFDYC